MGGRRKARVETKRARTHIETKPDFVLVSPKQVLCRFQETMMERGVSGHKAHQHCSLSLTLNQNHRLYGFRLLFTRRQTHMQKACMSANVGSERVGNDTRPGMLRH